MTPYHIFIDLHVGGLQTCIHYTHQARSQDFFQAEVSPIPILLSPLLLSPSLSYILPFPSLSFRNRPSGSFNNYITLFCSKTDPLPLLSRTVPDLLQLYEKGREGEGGGKETIESKEEKRGGIKTGYVFLL